MVFGGEQGRRPYESHSSRGRSPPDWLSAHELRKQGVEVVVYEETGSAGGRAQGFQEKGYTFDLGAQFSATLCDTTFKYMRELGMGTRNTPLHLHRRHLPQG